MEETEEKKINTSRLFDGKKIDVIEFVNTIANVSQRLDSLEKGQSEIKEILSGTLETPPPPAMSDPLELDPDSWINIAKSVLGRHEDHDTRSLMEFFEKGGFEWDPRGDAHAWCAAYVRATLAQAGLPVLESLKAADWKAYGEPCEEKYGAIVVGKSHVAFCLGDGKLIGGNQGDMVKEGNIEWYISNPVFRWPVA